MNRYLAGALAGLVATAPMTVAMVALHRRLPREEQYPLPPREITVEMTQKAGVREHLDEPEQETRATLANHFGFGAAAGALYAPLAEHVPGPPAVKGIAWGLAVWAGSYLGWLPAAGLYPPATEEPARRNALMIAAHVIWGAVTGTVTDRLQGRGGVPS